MLPRSLLEMMMPAPAEILLEGIALGRAQVAGLHLGNRWLIALREIFGTEEDCLSHPFKVFPAFHGQFSGFLFTDIIEGNIRVADNMEVVMDDVRLRDWEGLLDRQLVGLPHVHRDGFDAPYLPVIQAFKCFGQADLGATGSNLHDSSFIEIGQDRDVPMTLPDRLLIHAQVFDDLSGSSIQTASHSSLHDTSSLIPTDAQQGARTFDGLAGMDGGNDTFLEEHGESAIRLSPRSGDSQDSMFRAIRPGHPSMNEGLGLPHIQVTPDPIVCMVLDQAAFAACRTGQSTRSMINEHMDL